MCYYSFSNYLKKKYGTKVRRIGLDAGFSCPHKDDITKEGGCIFCNELGFSSFAGMHMTLEGQIEQAMAEIRSRKGANKFIAYFQNATGTNAEPDRLKEAYDIIKKYPDIVALYISTRPDCMDDEKLDLISGYTSDYEVWVEYGIQSVHDRTLEIVNRGHTFGQAVETIHKTAEKNIKVGAHIILGLPGESGEDMIATAKTMSALPVSGIKLHVLHVLKDTKLEDLYRQGRIDLLSRDDYVELACDFLEHIKPDCVIFRLVSDARKEYLIAPDWINNKLDVIKHIEDKFAERGTSQGNAMDESTG